MMMAAEAESRLILADLKRELDAVETPPLDLPKGASGRARYDALSLEYRSLRVYFYKMFKPYRLLAPNEKSSNMNKRSLR